MPEIVVGVSPEGITGRWRIYRDVSGRQIRRERVGPGADARKDSEAAELNSSGPVTVPARPPGPDVSPKGAAPCAPQS